MSGWYAVSRGITDHHLFKGNPNRLAVWMWLLDNAAWKDTTHDVKGRTVKVPRGSVCASNRHIAGEVGVGVQVVKTAIKRFQVEQMVNPTLTHGKNLIALCNYGKYQDLEKATNPEVNPTLTQPQPNPNPQKKQGNKVTREDTNVSLASKAATKKKTPRGSRLSEDWFLPTEWGEWAASEGWTENTIRTEADKFKDYWLSVAGSKGVKLDWRRTWNNWMRNSKTPKIIDGGRHGTSTHSTDGTANERIGRDPALEQISRLTGI